MKSLIITLGVVAGLVSFSGTASAQSYYGPRHGHNQNFNGGYRGGYGGYPGGGYYAPRAYYAPPPPVLYRPAYPAYGFPAYGYPRSFGYTPGFSFGLTIIR